MFLGNTRDAKVHKFIRVLKDRVHEKQEQLLQKNNEQLVERILRQKTFIKEYKNSVE